MTIKNADINKKQFYPLTIKLHNINLLYKSIILICYINLLYLSLKHTNKQI